MTRMPQVQGEHLNRASGQRRGGRTNRTSQWSLLINSQIPITTRAQGDRVRENMMKALDQLFTNEQFPTYIHFNIPDHHWDDEYIQNVNFRAAYELGPEQHRLHAHVRLRIDHNSNLSLDIKSLTALFNELFQDPDFSGNAYSSYRLLRTEIDFDKYVEKDAG